MIAGIGITTILAAILRQSASDHDELPFAKMAEGLWVLWDHQVDAGHPLAPSGVTSEDTWRINIALPPGWQWTTNFPNASMTVPDRIWGLKLSGEEGEEPMRRRFDDMVRDAIFFPSSVTPHAYFSPGIWVEHPGWTEKMLFEVWTETFRAFIDEARSALNPAPGSDEDLAADLIVDALNTLEKGGVMNRSAIIARWRDLKVDTSNVFAHGIRYILERRMLGYPTEMLIQDVLTHWTRFRRNGDPWGSATWEVMLEVGTAQFVLDRIREHLMAAEM